MANKIKITNVSSSISIPVASKPISEVLEMPHGVSLSSLLETFEQKALNEEDAEVKTGYYRVATACRTALNCNAKLTSSEYVISKKHDSFLLELVFPDYSSFAEFVSTVKVAP